MRDLSRFTPEVRSLISAIDQYAVMEHNRLLQEAQTLIRIGYKPNQLCVVSHGQSSRAQIVPASTLTNAIRPKEPPRDSTHPNHG